MKILEKERGTGASIVNNRNRVEWPRFFYFVSMLPALTKPVSAFGTSGNVAINRNNRPLTSISRQTVSATTGERAVAPPPLALFSDR